MGRRFQNKRANQMSLLPARRAGNGTRVPQELVGGGNAAWWWAIMQAPPDREQRKNLKSFLLLLLQCVRTFRWLHMRCKRERKKEKDSVHTGSAKSPHVKGGQRSHHVPGGSWWGLRWRWPCRSLWCPGCRWWRVDVCCWCHCCSSASGCSGFFLVW